VEIPEIDVMLLAALGPDVAVIDVRNPDEYEQGHLPGAQLVPLPELADRVDELPTGQPLYLVCAVGGRSLRACELLTGRGFDVTNVAGGTKAWIQADQPVTIGDQP
jgi:rhodanese-related sulfurtransferase